MKIILLGICVFSLWNLDELGKFENLNINIDIIRIKSEINRIIFLELIKGLRDVSHIHDASSENVEAQKQK